MKVSKAPEYPATTWAGGNAGTDALDIEAMEQLGFRIGRRPPNPGKRLERAGGGGLEPANGPRPGNTRREYSW